MKTRMLVAATLAAALLVPVIGQPAKADGAASTRNIIMGAAALVAGIAIESNVAHKNKVANTLVGYLPDGSPVYADGHVVLPNGQTYYPGNYGQQIACNGEACTITGGNGNAPYYGYNGSPYYGYGSYNGQPYYYNGQTQAQRSGPPYGNAYGYYAHRAAYANR